MLSRFAIKTTSQYTLQARKFALTPDETKRISAVANKKFKKTPKELSDQKEGNDDFLTTHFYSKTYLECQAEFNSTEASLPVLQADQLRALYQQQLETFQNEKVDQLRKDSVDEETIEKLRHMYLLRANTHVDEIAEQIKNVRFAARSNGSYRVVESDDVEKNSWMLTHFLNPTTTAQVLRSMFENSTSINETNREKRAKNVRRLRGFIGLARAVKKGLTSEQRQLLLNHLNPINDDVKKNVEEGVQKLINFGKQKDKKGAIAFLQEFSASLEKGIIQDYFMERFMVATEAIQEKKASLDKPSHKEVVASASTSVKKLDAKEDSEVKVAVLNFSNNDIQTDLEIFANFTSAHTASDELELLDNFAPLAQDIDEALLNDVANPHPLAFSLWQSRAEFVDNDRIAYTKKFDDKDNAHTVFKPVESYPEAQKLVDESPYFNSPVQTSPPWNTALEQIFHAKLIRLAEEIYDFKLDSELGLATFFAFLHEFDVSPGEDTLERCWSHPPPHHTYEELPILKFDGFEQDFEGIQLGDYQRQQRILQLTQEIEQEMKMLAAPK